MASGAGFGLAMRFDNATTVFPSVTLAGHASIFTGVYPGAHGIPGNQWFDRLTARTVDYLSAQGAACIYGFALFDAADCQGGLANRHLRVRTLYEAAASAGKSSIVSFNPYYKGATALTPSVLDALQFLRGDAVDFSVFDTKMMDRALSKLRDAGLPDILTLYFADADALGHALGISAQIPYLQSSVDAQIGRLIDLLQDLDRNWAANTLFVVTADHGRTDTTPVLPDTLAASRVADVLRRAGYEAERFQLATDGGMAHLYLRGRSGMAPWNEFPPPADTLLAARELFRDLDLSDSVYALLVRERGPGSGYRIFREDDQGELLLQVPDGQQSDLLRGLDSERSGDILILLKPGRYFLTKAQGEVTGHPVSHHGAIHAPDLAVPLVLANGGICPGSSQAPVGTVNIARTLANYLGFSIESAEAALPEVRLDECGMAQDVILRSLGITQE